MILIVESGSTKSDWVLSDYQGNLKNRFHTEGINPILLDRKEILSIISSNQELLKNFEKVSEIFFYAAGCGTKETDNKMKEIFQKLLSPSAEIIIKGDMAAAVYSVTSEPAVVCILGTGSNSCFFDGKNIVQKMPSLGYLLDDAGSGNAIGREILRSYYLEKMPRHLRRIFDHAFNMELEFVLTQLYQKSFPNRYLASFTKIAIQHLDKPFFQDLIKRNIRYFLVENLQPYKEELQRYPIHFIGSVGYYCRNIIEEELLQLNYKPGNFVKSPIDALVDNMLESPA